MQIRIMHIALAVAMFASLTASLCWPSSLLVAVWFSGAALLVLLGVARSLAFAGAIRPFWAVFAVTLVAYLTVALVCEPEGVDSNRPALLLTTHGLKRLQELKFSRSKQNPQKQAGIPLSDPFGPLSTLTYTGGQSLSDSDGAIEFMKIGQIGAAIFIALCLGLYSSGLRHHIERD